MQRLKLLVCISLICVYCYGKTAACSNEGTEITGYESNKYIINYRHTIWSRSTQFKIVTNLQFARVIKRT